MPRHRVDLAGDLEAQQGAAGRVGDGTDRGGDRRSGRRGCRARHRSPCGRPGRSRSRGRRGRRSPTAHRRPRRGGRSLGRHESARALATLGAVLVEHRPRGQCRAGPTSTDVFSGDSTVMTRRLHPCRRGSSRPSSTPRPIDEGVRERQRLLGANPLASISSARWSSPSVAFGTRKQSTLSRSTYGVDRHRRPADDRPQELELLGNRDPQVLDDLLAEVVRLGQQHRRGRRDGPRRVSSRGSPAPRAVQRQRRQCGSDRGGELHCGPPGFPAHRPRRCTRPRPES